MPTTHRGQVEALLTQAAGEQDVLTAVRRTYAAHERAALLIADAPDSGGAG